MGHEGRSLLVSLDVHCSVGSLTPSTLAQPGLQTTNKTNQDFVHLTNSNEDSPVA